MMRYFIEISYNGDNYHGWQKQKNAITIQEILIESASKILADNIDIVGSGRTDTGVHAYKMCAHFDSIKEINCQDFLFRINSFLPSDIQVTDIYRVVNEAHARFSAIKRTYYYYVSNKRNVFNKNIYVVHKDVNIEKMNEASSYLIGKHDFTSFAKAHSYTHTNMCDLSSAFWQRKEDDLIFSISANRFLRNMVRSIVGTLLEIGVGNKNPDYINFVLNQKKRSFAGVSVPANALFLYDIEYPDNIKHHVK